MTTLYFEAEREDDLRRVGYSKERRVDPQIIVGLLVDRGGFPLQVGCWEGNRAETATIIPVVETFQAAHGIAELVVVAGRRHALSRQPDGPGRGEAAVHRPGPGRSVPPGIWRPTSTGKETPPPTVRSSTPSPPEGAPGASATSAGVMSRCGPAHPSRLVESGMGVLQEARGPGQPDSDRSGQPGPGHPSPVRGVSRALVLSPFTSVTRPWMRPPSPGPGPWWVSRATSPTFPRI